jgi:hypothetical protein
MSILCVMILSAKLHCVVPLIDHVAALLSVWL